MVSTEVQGLNSVSIRQALAKVLASVAEVKVDLRLNRGDNIVLDLVQARQDMDLLPTLRKIKGRDLGTIREVGDFLQITRTRHTMLQEAHQTTMMEAEMREAIHREKALLMVKVIIASHMIEERLRQQPKDDTIKEVIIISSETKEIHTMEPIQV